MYYIQTRKPGEKRWKTQKVHMYWTLKDTLAALEDLCVHVGPEYRIVRTYTETVTRYMPVTVKEAKGGGHDEGA